MATNEILPFASTDTGTNLLTQAEYVADAQRTTGNQPGIARSKLVNKSLRQASLLAAGLAEFIADYQANNVTDSLTAQNIADYLYAAILNVSPVTPDATTTVKGKAELATNAETQAGTDATRIVTPAGLASLIASDTLRGLIEIANASEAAALTDNTRALTPLRLNDAFPQDLHVGGQHTGYIKLPGGLIIQWGTGGATGVSYAYFPIAFPNACMEIATGGDSSSLYSAGNYYQISTSGVNAGGFYWGGLRYDGTVNGGNPMTMRYIAVGY